MHSMHDELKSVLADSAICGLGRERVGGLDKKLRKQCNDFALDFSKRSLGLLSILSHSVQSVLREIKCRELSLPAAAETQVEPSIAQLRLLSQGLRQACLGFPELIEVPQMWETLFRASLQQACSHSDLQELGIAVFGATHGAAGLQAEGVEKPILTRVAVGSELQSHTNDRVRCILSGVAQQMVGGHREEFQKDVSVEYVSDWLDRYRGSWRLWKNAHVQLLHDQQQGRELTAVENDVCESLEKLVRVLDNIVFDNDASGVILQICLQSDEGMDDAKLFIDRFRQRGRREDARLRQAPQPMPWETEQTGDGIESGTPIRGLKVGTANEETKWLNESLPHRLEELIHHLDAIIHRLSQRLDEPGLSQAGRCYYLKTLAVFVQRYETAIAILLARRSSGFWLPKTSRRSQLARRLSEFSGNFFPGVTARDWHKRLRGLVKYIKKYRKD